MGENEEKMDYLEVDEPIPGQNYVCLSFVSPEALIESKESFKVAKFLQSICKDKDMDFKKVMGQYKDFTYKFEDNLQKDFDEQNEFKTNIRGLKVRGTYNTKDEAEKRAKKLQMLDSDFHVFVGQVGYWLPWDPCADKIEDESFINSQLNDMMEKYKENTINKDMFYEEQKREKIKAAKEEVIRKKKEEAEAKRLEQEKEGLEDGEVEEPIKEEPVEEEPVEEEPVEVIQEVVGEEEKKGCDDCPVKEVCDDCETCDDCIVKEPEPEPEPEPVKEEEVEEAEPVVQTGKIDSDLKQSLEDVDPWMASKLKEKEL